MPTEENGKTTLSYKDIKKRKKPMIRRVPIAMDGEKADSFNEAVAGLHEAMDKSAEDPGNKTLSANMYELKEHVNELRSDIEDYIVDFVFRSVGRRRYEELVSECPASKKQIADSKRDGLDEPGWNPDVFPPTLIAAALVEPEMTSEDVFEMWESEEWNQAELVTLFMAAMAVNAERKTVNLGKEFGLMDS